VAEEVAGGETLTGAAAAAGFSDSAHLSRTFRRAFGLPPSALLNMRSLEVDRSVQAGGGDRA
jgi:AraC-like DNA-binding protein